MAWGQCLSLSGVQRRLGQAMQPAAWQVELPRKWMWLVNQPESEEQTRGTST